MSAGEPNPTDLLSKMIQHHGHAAESLKTGQVDGERARTELGSLHIAVGVLASILIGGDSDPQRMHERRLELTKIRASHLYEGSRDSEHAVIAFATLGLKSLLLANGGALVALLTFLGSVQTFPSAKVAIWWAFALFVAGLFLALISVVFAYFAQSSVSFQTNAGAEGMFFHEYRGQDQLKEENFKDAASHHGIGNALRTTAIVTAFLSAIAFATGSGFGLAALMSAATP